MPEILIVKKFYLLAVIVGSFPVVAQVTANQDGISALATIIVLIFMLITILPELLLVFPGYRKEILSGIQDGDGKTDKNDLQYFISWYGPFGSLRALVFFSLFSMVENWDPPSILVWSIVAVGTGTALPQIKNFLNSIK